MRSRIKPYRPRQVMFNTWFPIKEDGVIYDRYCTYGKRFTLDYLHCLLLGHGPVIRKEVGIDNGKVNTTYYAQCCGRRYYPSEHKIGEDGE